MTIKRLYITFIIYAFAWLNVSTAQIPLWNNHRQKICVVQNEKLATDSLTILPSSIKIFTSTGDSLFPDDIFIKDNFIQLKPDPFKRYKGDTLRIHFQVISLDLGKSYFNLDSAQLAASDGVLKPWTPGNNATGTGIIESGELDYDGSFSRGFSVGNRQSLVMNSDFNLQMSGKISEDIEIQAVMSDANIPVQAEGNTYQLNEFDKVFIRLKMKQHFLSAGDLEIKNSPGYFSRYHKKNKGIAYTGTISPKEKINWNNELGYAVTKGKFARYQLEVQEGNQGPYRLRGSGNEQYLIILSGTEKIYYDGILLKRGRDFDYSIDYNTAELTFSVNRLISGNSRITVEFEYVDLSYSRSVQHLSSNLQTSRGGISFQMFNEMDSKSGTADSELDSISYSIMQNSGDNTAKLVRNGIVRQSAASPTQDEVLYKKVFEPVIQDSVLIYSNDQDSAKYTAYFTDVGEGQGSYIISEKTTVNGRVYSWVGPGKGRYEPVIRLKVPEQKMLLSLGGNYRFTPQLEIFSELSMSKLDLNRFSSLDSEDDFGLAGFFRADYLKKFTNKEKIQSDQHYLKANFLYEGIDEHFNPINPYREVEFSRNWNLDQTTEKTREHLVSSLFELKLSDYTASYQFSSLIKSGIFNGYRHQPSIGWVKGKLLAKLNGDFLWTNGILEKTTFFKPFFDIRYIGKNALGFSFNREKNMIKTIDSTIPGVRSFAFDNYRLYWDLKNNEKNQVQFFVNYREDFLPKEDHLVKNHYAVDAGLKGFWNKGEKMRLDYNINYRQLKVIATSVNPAIKTTGTMLGNLTHRYTSSNDLLILNTRAEIISGQEPKAEYIFIEVTNAGQGNYIWVDSNGDNIKQKGEFELSPFGDNANYIKIAQYNHAFIRVNTTMLYHDFQLNAAKFFKDKQKGFVASQLKKLSLLGNFRLDQKIRETNDGGFSTPFYFNPEDSILVGFRAISNITLYYNKANPIYDIRIESRYNQANDVQIDGMVRLAGRRDKGAVRYSGLKNLDLITSLNTGFNNYMAELYPGKNYKIDLFELEQELRYRISKGIALQGKYTFLNKKNKTGINETLAGHKLDLKISLRNVNQFNIGAGLTYSRMNYSGQAGNSIELAMMEGLKDGNNYQWNLQASRRMGNNVEMNIIYSGRKTGIIKTVHIASIQAKARF